MSLICFNRSFRHGYPNHICGEFEEIGCLEEVTEPVQSQFKKIYLSFLKSCLKLLPKLPKVLMVQVSCGRVGSPLQPFCKLHEYWNIIRREGAGDSRQKPIYGLPACLQLVENTDHGTAVTKGKVALITMSA